MKILHVILTSLFFTNTFGQELPQKNGCIEVQKIHHFFLRNKRGDRTKKISNKANRPYLLVYFDTSGNVIEQVGYGKHHNADLRVLDFVKQNKFEKGRLISSIDYNTDYHNNISADYNTVYLYNNSDQLIKEEILYYKTDSLYMQFEYEYDSNGNKTKTIFNPTHYYQRTFDTQSNLQSLRQISDSKLRWEWTFIYSDSMRIGNFRTYYNDGKNYTKQEIRKYRDGKLIEIEEKYTNQDGLSSKTILHYDKPGLIVRIDFKKSYSNGTAYKLESFTEIKTRLCRQLTTELINKVNDIIYDE